MVLGRKEIRRHVSTVLSKAPLLRSIAGSLQISCLVLDIIHCITRLHCEVIELGVDILYVIFCSRYLLCFLNVDFYWVF